MDGIILEACVESLEEAMIAEQSGAHRLEYCADLETGGLTPTVQEIDNLLDHVHLPTMIMIRPRKGDFNYSADEFKTMKKSIAFFKHKKILGFVFGITKEDELDYERIKELAQLCLPKEVCIHKAIDSITDPVAAVQELIKVEGITRILTSGGAATALEGAKTIKAMVKKSQQKISIMPAGQITQKNISQIHELIQAGTYHGRKIVGESTN
jgi:copper homeostasis protein